MNLQIISFQNLLELTQDLVVVLKDHGFLPKALLLSSSSLRATLGGSMIGTLPRYLVRGLQIMRKNGIHDLSTQQQDLESIPVNFESLLFVDSFDGV
jgi:hypothetical protein